MQKDVVLEQRRGAVRDLVNTAVTVADHALNGEYRPVDSAVNHSSDVPSVASPVQRRQEQPQLTRLLDMDVTAAAKLIRELGPALAGWPPGLQSPDSSMMSGGVHVGGSTAGVGGGTVGSGSGTAGGVAAPAAGARGGALHRGFGNSGGVSGSGATSSATTTAAAAASHGGVVDGGVGGGSVTSSVLAAGLLDSDSEPPSGTLTANMRAALQSGDAGAVQRLLDTATGFLDTQFSRRAYEFEHGLPSGAPSTILEGDRSSVVSLDSATERRLMQQLGFG